VTARVVVVGSINLDLVVTAPALPRPGETVLGDRFTMVPGGKGANQAVAAARAGAACAFVGAVGQDSFAGPTWPRPASTCAGCATCRGRRVWR
jgi:ribokinase